MLHRVLFVQYIGSAYLNVLSIKFFTIGAESFRSPVEKRSIRHHGVLKSMYPFFKRCDLQIFWTGSYNNRYNNLFEIIANSIAAFPVPMDFFHQVLNVHLALSAEELEKRTRTVR